MRRATLCPARRPELDTGAGWRSAPGGMPLGIQSTWSATVKAAAAARAAAARTWFHFVHSVR
jgi:hypothetical protein